MLKRFIAYYKPHKFLFIMDMSVAVIASALSITIPRITHRLLDIYIPAANLNAIAITLLLILAIYTVSAVFTYIRIKWGHIMGVRMEANMRGDFFRHLQKLSFRYYDNIKTGHLMSRITGDLENIAEIAHHAPEDLLISVCMILGSYAFMFSLNPALALISLIPLPFILIWGIIQGRHLKSRFRKVRARIADINAVVENTVQGIREVQSYANEPLEISRFDDTNSKFRSAKEDAYDRMARFHSVINYLRELYYFVVIVGGALLILKGSLKPVDLIAFLLYVSIILPPLDRLINFVEQYSQGAAAFERFIEIMDEEPDIQDCPEAITPKDASGRIELDHVSFTYEKDKDIVLADISLTIEPGQKIALVGESGAGKSTLVSLLPRFYEPQKGEVRIDGHPVAKLSSRWLRENIGLVQQNAFLFDTTLRDNISYGKPDADEDAIRKAAALAHILSFIDSLPDGLDTLVGERGVKLSGGQKQRIAIARIFLKNPPIVVFDEATSALDSETDALIQESMRNLCAGRTSVIIAHRLSTVREADRLYAMKNGRIVESGSHEELLAKGGYYRDLYERNLL
ncbi:MAG: ABC transporter ATP-binding protein/permease [Spirochaetes bacterium]|nr:ABC transporter ATP-binding protein/permease [Spirochaetota bacterium]MBU0954640.1 ABC transporter ATP-binding protein/permease [Spirochaetota bacterium]